MDLQPSVFRQTAFWTDNPDHAIEHLQSRFGDHSRVPIGRSPFGWGYRSYSSELLTIMLVTHAGNDVVNATVYPSFTLFHFPVTQGKEYKVGRRTFSVPPGHGIMLPPQHTYSVRSCSGTGVGVVVETDALMGKIERLCPGRRAPLGLSTTELRLSEQSRAGILGLVSRIERLHAEIPTAPKRDSLLLLRDELISRLAFEVARRRGVVAVSPRRRKQLEQVEDWIHENVGEAIDLEQLAEVAGVGARALSKTIRAARGVSPMELVTANRLKHARNLLSRGDARFVATVAADCGFSHLGRFAIAYRDAFGELPSETLARYRRNR